MRLNIKLLFLSFLILCFGFFCNFKVFASSHLGGYYYNNYGFSHFTRYDLNQVKNNDRSKGLIANFKNINILDLSSAKDERPGTIGQQMNVWDSWPLQDSNGNVVDYKGYHITFALTGNPNLSFISKNNQNNQDSRIFLYYQKVGKEYLGVKSWHSAGPVFMNPTEGVKGHDGVLSEQVAQWAGTTIMMSNHTIRMFYTTYNGTNNDDWQSIATAKLKLNVTHNGISIDHKKTSGNKTILEPDGKYYQKNSQIEQNVNDENVFRDPHYFEYKGKKYITFSASSGYKSGPDGNNTLENIAYIGGNKSFIKDEHDSFYDSSNNINSLGKRASINNAVIGVAELNDNFTLKRFIKPILGFNTVTDEFERPNLFKHNGKWYLFGVTRGYKLATANLNNLTDSFMLGFVGKTPFGPFKPLNKNGLVIKNSEPWDSRYYTYSFYVLNSNKSKLLVTNYMTNPIITKHHMTFAPTMVLKLKGNRANIISNDVLPQGDIVDRSFKYVKH